ncbi:hypothetical protein ACQEVY_21005 [Streptomyces sp. CA-288835]|uniref:hypothetical protein n=1 Tax=Streptomyces sp. CA-288835 TaxID=3240069 RepID=UPI003D91EB94
MASRLGFGAQPGPLRPVPPRTPLYYPDAATLAPGADPGRAGGRIDTTAPGANEKYGIAHPSAFH